MIEAGIYDGDIVVVDKNHRTKKWRYWSIYDS
jgi:SOS-response transcriptional repressor LexA